MMRNIKVILACLFLLVSCKSFALESKPESQGQFIKGLNTYINPLFLNDQELSEATNVYYDKGKVLTREGYNDTSNQLAADIIGLYQYTQPDGDTWSICKTDGGKIYKMEAYDGTWDEIGTGFNASIPCFVTFVDAAGASILIMFDGGVPQKWDGAAAAVSNLLDTGLGNAPNNKYAIVLNQRLFAAGNPTYPNRLYYTDIDDGEDWTTHGAYRTIDGDDGDAITGLANYAYFGADIYNKIFLTKKKKLYLINVDDANPTNWVNDLINTQIGCYSHWTIQNVGMSMVFWDGWRVQALSGITLVPLSIQIHDELTSIQAEYRDTLQAAVWNDNNHYYLSFVPSGGTTHTVIYVFDFALSAWAKWDNMKAESLGVLYDSGDETFKMCMGGSDGYLYELWNGTNDNGTAITSVVTTKSYVLTGIEYMKFLQYGYVLLGGVGAWTVEFGSAIDETSNFTYNNIDTDSGGFILGTDVLGVGVLGGSSIVRSRFDRDEEIFAVKFRVRETDLDEYFEWYGLSYYYQILGYTEY
jgi:hypothetical protein